MHYHLEVVIPPTTDIESAVAQVMKPFNENLDDEDEDVGPNGFWDWYVIGGRWAGYKSELQLDEDKLAEFRAWLIDESVMVKSFQAGKQQLADNETIAKVDAKWREMFPNAGEKCTLFSHSNNQYNEALPADVCRLSDVPGGLIASRVIFAMPNDDGTLRPEYMAQSDYWNGCNFVKSAWDGKFESALSEYKQRLSRYSPEYKEKTTPTDDWLVVTVDYHS